MSDDQPPEGQNTKLLAIGAAGVALLALLVALVALFLVFDAREDASAAQEQARKLSKTIKSLQEEAAAIKTAAPARPEPARRTDPGPAHMDAVDTAHDCVLRPGDPKGLADCIKAGG